MILLEWTASFYMVSEIHNFADVPFAKLDAILLLIKTCLKGEIVDILNAKDNQVFLDYLAGGQSQQIALEREANAQSSSALNVAARNAVGIDEAPPAPPPPPIAAASSSSEQQMQQQLCIAKELAVQLGECKNAFADLPVVSVVNDLIAAAKELAVQFGSCKDAFADFMGCRLEMETKLHEQTVRFAKEKASVDKDLKEQAAQQAIDLARDQSAMEAQLKEKALEQDRAKAAFEAEHAKTMAEIEATRINTKKRSLEIDEEHETALLKVRLEYEEALSELRMREAAASVKNKRAKVVSSSSSATAATQKKKQQLKKTTVNKKKKARGRKVTTTVVRKVAVVVTPAPAPEEDEEDNDVACGLRRSTRNRAVRRY
jgi:hypothetical protein